MGERQSTQFRPSFNRSLVIEGQDERLTNVAGVTCLRELDERLGLTEYIASGLRDPRDQSRVRHSHLSQLRSLVYMMAAFSCAQVSAADLANDPALKLAAGEHKGTHALGEEGKLASQATLSRFFGTLAEEANLDCLREGLFQSASRGIRAAGGGKKLESITLDIDSYPHREN